MQLWSPWLLYGIKTYLHLNPGRCNVSCVKCFACVCAGPECLGHEAGFPGGGSGAGRDRAPRWHQKPPDFCLLQARGWEVRLGGSSWPRGAGPCPPGLCFPLLSVLQLLHRELSTVDSRHSANSNKFQPCAALLSKYLIEMLLQPFYFFTTVSRGRQCNMAYVKMLIE